MTISALPSIPKGGDSGEVFASKADAVLAALPDLVTDTNLVAVAAATALQNTQSALDHANNTTAPFWVPGVTYSTGNVVISPINGLLYRGGSLVSIANNTSDPCSFNDNYIWVLLTKFNDVGLSIAQTLSNKKLTSVSGMSVNLFYASVSGFGRTLNLAEFCAFDITLSSNLTISFSNAPAAIVGISQEIDVIIRRTGGSSYTVTWPAGIVWLTTGLTAPATADIEHYQLTYSSSTNEYFGRLVGYKPHA